ncbi:MAG TPA: hypothetical protein PLD27_12705 [bacterium]|nr:hypothetical protein [bacterium]
MKDYYNIIIIISIVFSIIGCGGGDKSNNTTISPQYTITLNNLYDTYIFTNSTAEYYLNISIMVQII